MSGLARREVCRLGAAGALTMTGLAAGSGTVLGSARAATNGHIVFVYDDSWREDWTETFPVHREEGVPACCAAVSDRIGASWTLLPEHLREMADEGWEIMSHTASHLVVGNLYLTEPAAPEDERVYLDGGFLSDRAGEGVVIGDGDRAVENAVAGGDRDETGIYLDLEQPVGERFDAGSGFVRVSDDRVREEVVGSKETLEELGVDVDGFVSPYGRSDGLVADLVREHYAAFANGGGYSPNALEGLDPYTLGRSSIDGQSADDPDIERFYDEVAAGDYLGIVVGHSQFDETTPERIRFAIREAKARDLEIVTLREALRDLDAWPLEDDGSAATDDGAETDGGDGVAPDTGTNAESQSTGDRIASAVRENRTPILGTGAAATVGAAGAAAYRRFNRSDDGRL